VIVYAAVPYLVAAAPPLILLLSILFSSCTMTRPGEAIDRSRFYSQADSRAGEELVRELDRRAAREELQHTLEEAQR
jgi:hypothetical protein